MTGDLRSEAGKARSRLINPDSVSPTVLIHGPGGNTDWYRSTAAVDA
jgi:pimeloyl-ACP methyl ester carboxylesterase